jgi:hypothetical protein
MLGLSTAISRIGAKQPSSLLGGLVAYWKLNEPSGERADAHGVYDLAEYGSVTVPAAQGKIAWGADFSGEGPGAGALFHPDDAAFSFGDQPFTVTGWVKDTYSQSHFFVAKATGASAASDEYWLGYAASASRFRWVVSSGAVRAILDATAFGAPAPGAWYFLAAWHDPAEDRVYLQVNDAAPAWLAHSAGCHDGANDLVLGMSSAYAAGSAALGVLDEVGIWARLLTAEERSSLYNGGRGLTHPF